MLTVLTAFGAANGIWAITDSHNVPAALLGSTPVALVFAALTWGLGVRSIATTTGTPWAGGRWNGRPGSSC